MKKQMIILMLILVGITLLISGGIFYLVGHYKNNRQVSIESEKNLYALIDNNYNRFQEKINTLEEEKQTVYEGLYKFITYFQEMPNEYENITKVFEGHETFVKDIDTLSDFLKDKCIDRVYDKNATMLKCKTFMLNYESAINGFVQDVKVLNNKIEEYNEWIVEHEKEEYKPLEKFVPKIFKEYIDVNKDGTFTGLMEE